LVVCVDRRAAKYPEGFTIIIRLVLDFQRVLVEAPEASVTIAAS